MWAISKGVTHAGVESKSFTVNCVASVKIARNSLVFLSNKSRIEVSEEGPNRHFSVSMYKTFAGDHST